MKLVLGWLLLFNCIVATGAVRNAEGNFVDDRVLLSGKGRSGPPVEFLIVRVVWPSKGIYEGANYWGAAAKRPKYIVSRLDVKVNGERAYVPISVYGDLAEPMQVRLLEDARSWKLEIVGGSGADAYTAVLTFDNAGWIVRKRVQSLVMAADVWEETRYGFMKNN